MSPTRYLHRPPPGDEAPLDFSQPSDAVPEPSASNGDGDEEPLPHLQPVHDALPKVRDPWPVRVAVVAVVLLGLALRLQEPMSSPVIGAEDPYLHMERTWDLARGRPVSDYPPGLMLLLLPAAWAGPEAFYWVVRFAPPLAGAAFVAGVYVLCRRHLNPTGALSAGALAALMPEAIRRTDLLFPTAIDLALLPWFLLLVLQLPEARARTWLAITGFALVFLLVHPWLLALLLLPLGLYGLVMAVRRSPTWGTTAAASGTAVVGVAAFAVPTGGGAAALRDRAAARFAELAADPGTLTPLPLFVDLPAMLGWTALVLAVLGVAVAFWRRTRFSLLALCMALTLLPVVLVDWLGIWYLPHRTVAYMAVGVAMLAALPIAALAQAVASLEATTTARRALRNVVPAFAVVALVALSVPAAAATEPWYRIYGEDEYAAWIELDERGTDHVVAGSWQARAGYRALTGRDAEYNPHFFQDNGTRDAVLQREPDLVVLVDNYTREAGLPTDFLSDWRPVGTWGQTSAYAWRDR